MVINENNNSGDSKVCPSCFTEIEKDIDFCRQCGRPVGNLVNYDPLKRIWSQGWIYRKAVSGSSSPIILVGIWILFGLPFVGMLFFLLTSGARGFQSIVVALGTIIYGIILYRVTGNYLCRRKENESS